MDTSDEVFDSGITPARRDVYEQLGRPFGTRTIDFLRWIAASSVDREGKFPSPDGRVVRFVEQNNGHCRFRVYVDDVLIGQAPYYYDYGIQQCIFAALGVKYEYTQE